MGKHRKKKGRRWDHPNYKKGVYCFERDGYVHTYIFGKRKSIKNLPWDKLNKEFAMQVLSKRLGEYHERQNGFNRNRIETFSELFLLYKDINYKNLKRNTKVTHLSYLKLIMNGNDLNLNDHIGMTKYFSQRAEELFNSGYASSTIRIALTTIKTIFKFGIEQDIIKLNPIKKWTFPKKEKHKFVICTREQLDKAIDAVKKYAEDTNSRIRKTGRMKVYYALKLISHTGMRIGEVEALKTKYVLEDKLLIFGKGDKWREFPYSVSKGLKELLYEILDFNKNHLNNHEKLLGPGEKIIRQGYRNMKNSLNFIGCEEVKFHAIRKLVENEMMNDYSLNDNIVRSLIGYTITTQSKHYLNKLSAEEIEAVISINKLKKDV